MVCDHHQVDDQLKFHPPRAETRVCAEAERGVSGAVMLIAGRQIAVDMLNRFRGNFFEGGVRGVVAGFCFVEQNSDSISVSMRDTSDSSASAAPATAQFKSHPAIYRK